MLRIVQINAINLALGAKVADFRRVNGWSQAQLAERFGAELGRPVDATTITRLEQGRRPVPVHELIALSRVLSVEPTVFFKFLGPLDDAVAAMRIQVTGHAAKAKIAKIEADAAIAQKSQLESLQRYRETGEHDALVDGIQFLFTIPEFERDDWKELLLDASVPVVSIDAAIKQGGEPAVDGTDSYERTGAFVAALLKDVFDPPKRRRKTGREV